MQTDIMQTEVTQAIAEKIKKLNPEQQNEVLEFVKQKISTIKKKKRARFGR